MAGMVIGGAALVVCALVGWSATVVLAEVQLELDETSDDRDPF